MIVLDGTLALANPEPGGVVRAEQGEAVFFRAGTWHHGFNVGAGSVRVRESFSPTPATGASNEYADDHPPLPASEWTYTRPEVPRDWPMRAGEAPVEQTLYPVGKDEILWSMEGTRNPTMFPMFADTEQVRSGYIDLPPGQHTDPHDHAGDEGVYVPTGTAYIHCPDERDEHWFELSAGDACDRPAGVKHVYHNQSEQPVRLYFGLSPNPAPE